MPKRIDLANQVYGRLTVISLCPERDPWGQAKWECECECGKKVNVVGANLRKGLTKSCGCLRQEVSSTLIDLVGKTFGMLQVVERHPENGTEGQPRWVCVCKCGKQTIVRGQNLRVGGVQSCGCKKSGAVSEARTIHGHTQRNTMTLTYSSWCNMKSRCYDLKNNRYDYYGGRGITVCQEWQDSFEAFFAYVGERPEPSYSLDRIDNNGNYEPGNVRWATQVEQRHNRRDSQ